MYLLVLNLSGHCGFGSRAVLSTTGCTARPDVAMQEVTTVMGHDVLGVSADLPTFVLTVSCCCEV